MAIYKTSDNKLWDDMGGEAKNFPSWPKDTIQITDEEADAIRQAEIEALPKPKELTPSEKLAAAGLSVSELKTLLGL